MKRRRRPTRRASSITFRLRRCARWNARLLAGGEVASRCRPFARITRKRASALKDAKQVASCDASAERSEAREDGRGRNSSSRVASPLVMATRGKEARFDDVRLTRCACSQRKPLPPASQGGSATRNDRRHRRQPLRLRSAPPSATPLSPQVASAYSTVTDFARLRGLSTSLPRMTAA